MSNAIRCAGHEERGERAGHIAGSVSLMAADYERLYDGLRGGNYR